MKLSDFFIRSRHLFGFLFPGLLWIAFFYYCCGLDLAEYIGQDNTLVRAIAISGVAYIVGFVAETLIFPWIGEPLRNKIDRSKINKLESQVIILLKSKLTNVEASLNNNDIFSPEFCKNYVLENSNELKYLVHDKEDEINFIIANALPGLFFTIALLFHFNYKCYVILIIASLIIAVGYFLIEPLILYMQKEREEWYEFFIISYLSKSKKESEQKPKPAEGQTT